MGCGSSIGHQRAPSPITEVEAFTAEDDEDTVAELEEEPEDVDFSLGFTSKACTKFAVDDDEPDSKTRPNGGHNAREETDEFRVMRVSSLSGLVTLYVAGGKHKKPGQYSHDRLCPRAEHQPSHCNKCPFCVGNERKTPPSILMFGPDGEPKPCSREEGGWGVRVFPNIFPMLICPLLFYGTAHEEALDNIPHSAVARGVHHNMKIAGETNNDPTCRQVDAEGVSEVIVESPTHNALLALSEPRAITMVLEAVVARGKVLSKQTWAKQLLIFKQWGPLSGGSLVHPHTQIVSLPVLPPQLISRLEYSMHIFQKHKRCATCLACVDPFIRNLETLGEPDEGQLPSRVVHVTEHFVVSVPYASSSQYSMTIAPRRHSSDFMQITRPEMVDLAKVLSLLAQAIYVGLDDPSYNLYVRTAPSVEKVQLGISEASKEELDQCFHWIVEFRPRFPADLGGFEIASGVRVVTGLPEDHAAHLRDWVKDRLKAGAKPIESKPPPPREPSPALLQKRSSALKSGHSITRGSTQHPTALGGRLSFLDDGPRVSSKEKSSRRTVDRLPTK